MHVLVTGGSGFFGKSLLARWKKNPGEIRKVTILSRRPEVIQKNFALETLPFEVFLMSHDVLEPLSWEGKVDFVIHGASPSQIQLGRENPDLLKKIVVEGTQNVLTFSKKAGVKKFLLISSGAAYGGAAYKLTVYGEAKLAAEKLCAEAGLDYSVARCFAFLGPYLPLDTHYAAGNFIRDGLSGGPIRIMGDGTPLRSYLYSDDLADWLWTILKKGKPGAVYDVGSDEAVTIKELAELVSEAFKGKPKVEIMGTPDPSKSPERYLPDIAKAKTELRLNVAVPLREAIAKTVVYHLARLSQSQ